MSRFASDATLNDVLKDKELKDYSEYFYYEFPKEIYNKKIDDISWYAREGINWFNNLKEKGNTAIYHFKGINLIHVSHKNHSKFAFIVSGGGLCCIDTAHEGFPIGEKLFSEGYDVFFLTYRLKEKAKLNNTTKDINNALAFINENKDSLNVDVKDFILMGFSAGAYIAASYCSNNRGYIKYRNLKPKCLGLLYPIVDFHIEEKNIKEIVIKKHPSNYLINRYSIVNHVKGSFPPTFIVHCKDDDCVPIKQSELLCSALKKNNIKYQFQMYKNGKHGWGIGKRLEPEGWLDSFIKFSKNL